MPRSIARRQTPPGPWQPWRCSTSSAVLISRYPSVPLSLVNNYLRRLRNILLGQGDPGNRSTTPDLVDRISAEMVRGKYHALRHARRDPRLELHAAAGRTDRQEIIFRKL